MAYEGPGLQCPNGYQSFPAWRVCMDDLYTKPFLITCSPAQFVASSNWIRVTYICRIWKWTGQAMVSSTPLLLQCYVCSLLALPGFSPIAASLGHPRQSGIKVVVALSGRQYHCHYSDMQLGKSPPSCHSTPLLVPWDVSKRSHSLDLSPRRSGECDGLPHATHVVGTHNGLGTVGLACLLVLPIGRWSRVAFHLHSFVLVE